MIGGRVGRGPGLGGVWAVSAGAQAESSRHRLSILHRDSAFRWRAVSNNILCSCCIHTRVLCLVTWSCPALCDLMDCSLPGFSVYGDSLGKSIGVGCHSLLQGIFPNQGSKPGLPHCRQIPYLLNHEGSPRILE